jgi:hypothetical protein
MKRILMSSVFALSLFATSALAEELTGVITCSKCKHTEESAGNCAKKCIKSGVPPIFVSNDGKTYKIANPDKVGEAINEKVVVTGSVDQDTLTIESVKAEKS